MSPRALPAAALALALALAGCRAAPPPHPFAFPSPFERPDPRVRGTRVLSEDGGFLDWCAGSDRIAFSRERQRSGRSHVYTIRPDGSDLRCLTCGGLFPAGGAPGADPPASPRAYYSSPAWHPSCEFLVIQVAGPHAGGTAYERAPFGIHHDLWLVAADGSGAELLEQAEPLGGSMSPVFSQGGDRISWSARRDTGEKVRPAFLDRTPGKQNPWDGWHLAVADFARPPGGPALLSNRRELYAGEGGIKRPSALDGETLWFSLTPNPRAYVDEIFRAQLDGSERVNLSESPGTWEEQPQPSPWGTLVAYRSSLPTAWENPPQPQGTLRLELWALTRDGRRLPLTELNDANRHRRVLVQDFAWGPTGEEIALYTARIEAGQTPRYAIEILTLNAAF